MSETPPDPEPFPWLPSARVLRWLNLTTSDDRAALAEDCRRAAADWCETQRPDLVDTAGVFVAPERVVQAGVMAAARLFARVGSPTGLVSYAELGAAEILRLDPDVTRLLGTGVNAPPRVG